MVDVTELLVDYPNDRRLVKNVQTTFWQRNERKVSYNHRPNAAAYTDHSPPPPPLAEYSLIWQIIIVFFHCLLYLFATCVGINNEISTQCSNNTRQRASSAVSRRDFSFAR